MAAVPEMPVGVENQFDTSHLTGHVISAGAIVLSWAGIWFSILPILFVGLSSFVALVWYVLQIYKYSTVKVWLMNRRLRKIARLQAKIIELEAKQVLDKAIKDAIKSTHAK